MSPIDEPRRAQVAAGRLASARHTNSGPDAATAIRPFSFQRSPFARVGEEKPLGAD
jgi:hypothetical protein